MTFPGSSKDIEAHSSWIRGKINWYGILWVGIVQCIVLGAPVVALTVIAAAI